MIFLYSTIKYKVADACNDIPIIAASFDLVLRILRKRMEVKNCEGQNNRFAFL